MYFVEEHDTKQASQGKKVEAKVYTDAEIASLVDVILENNDTNNDGYIDFVELIEYQRKHDEDEAAAKEKAGK